MLERSLLPLVLLRVMCAAVSIEWSGMGGGVRGRGGGGSDFSFALFSLYGNSRYEIDTRGGTDVGVSSGDALRRSEFGRNMYGFMYATHL